MMLVSCLGWDASKLCMCVEVCMHVKDSCVYQGGEGIPNQRNELKTFACSTRQSMFTKQKMYRSLFRTKNVCADIQSRTPYILGRH